MWVTSGGLSGRGRRGHLSVCGALYFFMVLLYVFCDVVYVCDTRLVLGKAVGLKGVSPVLSKDVNHLCWVSDVHSIHCKVVKALPWHPLSLWIIRQN